MITLLITLFVLAVLLLIVLSLKSNRKTEAQPIAKFTQNGYVTTSHKLHDNIKTRYIR